MCRELITKIPCCMFSSYLISPFPPFLDCFKVRVKVCVREIKQLTGEVLSLCLCLCPNMSSPDFFFFNVNDQ